MNRTIAVIAGVDGKTAVFFEGIIIKVFSKTDEGWIETDDLAYSINTSLSLRDTREEIIKIEASLAPMLSEDSKIIVGSIVTGIPYNIFDLAGYTIFEIEGSPEQFLDEIEMQMQMDVTIDKPKDGETIIFNEFPVLTDNGKYFMDLKTLQIKKPGVTSKQALLPFLTNETFYSLELVCAHIPPWFDRDFDRLGLIYSAKKSGNSDLHVTVAHKVCGSSEDGEIS
jgi:Fe-only nitrogenase accessory protein AnfO